MALFGWLSFRDAANAASPESITTAGEYGFRAPSLRSGPGMTADEKDLRRTTSIPDQVGAEMLAGIHAQALPRHRDCVLDQEQRGPRHVDRPDAAPERKLGVGLAHPRFILLVG